MRSPVRSRRDATDRLVDAFLHRYRIGGDPWTAGLQHPPTCSINFGAAGIAYALYRIAQVRGDAAVLALADVWSARAQTGTARPDAFVSASDGLAAEIVGQVSPYHTRSGVESVALLVAQARGDVVSAQRALAAFVDASTPPCDNHDVTLGRAGTLIAASVLLEAVSLMRGVDTAPLRDFASSIAVRSWETLSGYGAIAECTEYPLLGIAHGWAGNLYALLRWHEAAKTPVPDTIEPRLAQLAALGEPHRRGLRWRRRITTGTARVGDYMAGWCNGTAGQLFLWVQAHRMFRDERYFAAAHGAAWATFAADESPHDLCCGFAGRAYALLALYRHTGEREWLARAVQLAEMAVRRVQDGPQPWPDSLYKGAVGVAVLAADLARPELAAMPFFESEGWHL